MNIMICESNNNGDYEDYWYSTYVVGIFSSPEKAIEITKKIYNKYSATEDVISEYNLEFNEKEIHFKFSYGQGYVNKWDRDYIIKPILVDEIFDNNELDD